MSASASSPPPRDRPPGIWIPGRGTYVQSSTFTATAILRLVDQGTLSLDSPLESHVQYPERFQAS